MKSLILSVGTDDPARFLFHRRMRLGTENEFPARNNGVPIDSEATLRLESFLWIWENSQLINYFRSLNIAGHPGVRVGMLLAL